MDILIISNPYTYAYIKIERPMSNKQGGEKHKG